MLNLLLFQTRLCRPDGSDPRKGKPWSSPQHFFFVPESAHPQVRGDAEEHWQNSEEGPPSSPGFPIGSHHAELM